MDPGLMRRCVHLRGGAGELCRAATRGLNVFTAPAILDELMERGVQVESLANGMRVLVYAVPYFYAGVVAHVTLAELVLDDAQWVLEVGRLGTAVRDWKFAEAEPVGRVTFPLSSVSAIIHGGKS